MLPSIRCVSGALTAPAVAAAMTSPKNLLSLLWDSPSVVVSMWQWSEARNSLRRRSLAP